MKLDADFVRYMAQGEGDPDGARVVERLEAACAQGGASFHGAGIEPGWAAEVLPLTMSGLFSRIDALLSGAAGLFDLRQCPDGPTDKVTSRARPRDRIRCP
jgi:hypothetical protein